MKIKHAELIKWHNALEFFNYDIAVDWAIDLIKNGIESENVLIVASFSKPTNREEIKPYVSAALRDLNIEERYGEFSVIAQAHFYLDKIVKNQSLKSNLIELYNLSLRYELKFGLKTFYLIYHGWCELEEMGFNFYYDGMTLDNFEQVLKEQAQIWMNHYVLKE